jgi:hypothetical protein
MDPLSQLMLLLLEDHGSPLASTIERETKAWIQQQFVRVMILLGINSQEFSISAMCRSKREFIYSTAKRIPQSS